MKEYEGHVLKSKGHKPHPILRVVLPPLIIAGALLTAVALVKTTPKPERRPPKERVVIVEVLELKKGTGLITLDTTGTVTPSREITLQPRVAGTIIRSSPQFIPGGRFQEGEIIMEIDPSDYQIALTSQSAGLAKAEQELQIELGMQDVALHEWEAMQKMTDNPDYNDMDKELALREPHLRLSRANLKAAEAQLQQATLNLERTKVRAPFNTVVRSRSVDLGSQVSAQTPLAELAGIDTCWIRTTLPTGEAHWITPADQDNTTASPAAITSVPGIDLHAEWQGRVLRMLPDLEPAGRQVQLIVEVPNPDQPSKGNGTLLLGAYVQISIEGPEIKGVFSIPRRALHDGTSVWIMNAENRLDIRKVDIAWTDDKTALISAGMEEGERLVITDISTPLSGLLLTTVDAMNKERETAEVTPPENPKGDLRP